MLQAAPRIIILRQKQVLLRALKLWVVVDDKTIYNLAEGSPLLIHPNQLPVKIVAQNGYHASKPFFINTTLDAPVYIKVGCSADNEQFWGSIIAGLIFFVLFVLTGFYILLLLANFPILFLAYQFFYKHKEFIKITPIKVIYDKPK